MSAAPSEAALDEIRNGNPNVISVDLTHDRLSERSATSSSRLPSASPHLVLMTDRIHNFGAGPGVLPEPVLKQAQQDIWNIGGSGIGIAEHSHRGKLFERIIAEAEE